MMIGWILAAYFYGAWITYIGGINRENEKFGSFLFHVTIGAIAMPVLIAVHYLSELWHRKLK